MPNPTAFNGPVHIFQKRAPLGNSGGGSYDAPSIIMGGTGVQDTRYGFGGSSGTAPGILGWYGPPEVKTVSQVPSAISTTNIAAAQTVTSGTKMTLVSSTGSGITVLAAQTFSYPFENYIPAGACVIDGLPTIYQLGAEQPFTGFYSPAFGVARCVSITAAAGATGGAMTIAGADWYGQSMTQTVTTAAGTTVNTSKAFKYVYSVTPAFTDGSHNYSVGTSDVYGAALAFGQVADIRMYWNQALVSAPTFVAADGTTPATATTGDVRGTVTVPSASDGTKRLDLFVLLTARVVSATTMQLGLFGVTNA